MTWILSAAIIVGLLTNYLLWRKTVALQDDVNTLTLRLSAAKDCILNRIADLEAAVSEGQTVDLSGLTAAADALDQIAPPV